MGTHSPVYPREASTRIPRRILYGWPLACLFIPFPRCSLQPSGTTQIHHRRSAWHVTGIYLTPLSPSRAGCGGVGGRPDVLRRRPIAQAAVQHAGTRL